jgi:cephalosporin hydroxylase
MTAEEITDMAMHHLAAQKHDELIGMVRLLLERRPRSVVEIGTMQGGTLAAWCACAADDAVIVSVDLPGGEWGGGYSADRCDTIRDFARDGQELVLIQGNSQDPDTIDLVERTLDGRTVEFLFIDGDHTYEGVAADWNNYSRLVTPGGLVAFHDILPHPPVPKLRVDQFWRDLSEALRDRPLW